jgi:carbonic anhydrase
MKIISTLLKTTMTVALFTPLAIAQEVSAHWGYTGHNSPQQWAELSPKNKMCGIGKNQAPINITASLDANLEALEIKYTQPSANIINNGHTIQVNIKDGDTIGIDGISFGLKQFHFHTPSENNIDGKSFPLEAHFVHLDKNGNIAVLALMFEEGEENINLAKIWEKMPTKANETNNLSLDNIATTLLPKNRDYYRFNGSLTTPPCSEGVRWVVLKTPVTISKAQVEKFLNVMKHPNNRPIQNTNARVIIK